MSTAHTRSSKRKRDATKITMSADPAAPPPSASRGNSREARGNTDATQEVIAGDLNQRRAMIHEAAYFRAETRGFEPGHEVDDWLEAEAEIDRRLANGEKPTLCGE